MANLDAFDAQVEVFITWVTGQSGHHLKASDVMSQVMDLRLELEASTFDGVPGRAWLHDIISMCAPEREAEHWASVNACHYVEKARVAGCLQEVRKARMVMPVSAP